MIEIYLKMSLDDLIKHLEACRESLIEIETDYIRDKMFREKQLEIIRLIIQIRMIKDNE